ncbi:CLIP domain-containing serine protease B4-like [Anopheles bellator]|uniref:CLIP domain-containing serine protease B4-like n=1 Tax=Anopheles bellator TaxID=139047 RepID=UPI002647FCC1|nr:CLIP domain-containing serine protease B4-like [Anopheles bellator]
MPSKSSRLQVIVAVAVAVAFGVTSAQYLDPCTTPERTAGTCVLVAQCSYVRTLLYKPVLTANDVQYLESSRCGVRERKVLVCCAAPDSVGNPTTPTTPTRPSAPPSTTLATITRQDLGQFSEQVKLLPKDCGIQYSDRIIGGERAKIDEFPWTALIQHRRNNGDLKFHCGGSLISNRYVLTAAHCINNIARSWTITAVRLGEWDLQAERDCTTIFDEQICADPVQDIAVERLIVHPNYATTLSRVKNDIALIRLVQPAQFTDFVQPICLPLSDGERTRSYDGQSFMVAGWGQTEEAPQSQYKLFVVIKGVQEASCQQSYPRADIDGTQVCAGGDANKDSCRGDSGGPLMYNGNSDKGPLMYLAGVVSFGRKCGLQGVPGVYTRVNQYLEWIVGTLEP